MPPTAAKRGSKKTGQQTKKKAPIQTSGPMVPKISPVDKYIGETFDKFRGGSFKQMSPTEVLLCRKIEDAEKAQVAHSEALAKLQTEINKLQGDFATHQNLRDRAQATATAHIDTLRGMFEMVEDNATTDDGDDDDTE